MIAQMSHFGLLMVFSTTLWVVPSILFSFFEPNVSVLRSVVPCPMFFNSEGLPCPRAAWEHALTYSSFLQASFPRCLLVWGCAGVLHVVCCMWWDSDHRLGRRPAPHAGCPPLSYTHYSPIGKTTLKKNLNDVEFIDQVGRASLSVVRYGATVSSTLFCGEACLYPASPVSTSQTSNLSVLTCVSRPPQEL